MSKIILFITHFVYLTKNERYALHNKESVETTGVSLPVWYWKGSTSEPATEIFCKYLLENNINEKSSIGLFKNEGYKINLPQIPENFKRNEVSLEKWRSFSEDEKYLWESKNKIPINSNYLLDYKDGGGESMSWKQINKMTIKDKKVSVKNLIEIKDINVLNKSLYF